MTQFKIKSKHTVSNESEYQVCKAIAQYLDTQYPNVIYHFDYGAGVKLSIGSAVKMKALNKKGYPDLFIAEPRGIFHGLFIEIKKDNEKIRKRNFTYKDIHIQEQAEYLNKLSERGYKAEFGIGFEECRNIIQEYLNL